MRKSSEKELVEVLSRLLDDPEKWHAGSYTLDLKAEHLKPLKVVDTGSSDLVRQLTELYNLVNTRRVEFWMANMQFFAFYLYSPRTVKFRLRNKWHLWRKACRVRKHLREIAKEKAAADLLGYFKLEEYSAPIDYGELNAEKIEYKTGSWMN